MSLGGCLRDDMVMNSQGYFLPPPLLLQIRKETGIMVITWYAGVAAVFACVSSAGVKPGGFSGSIDASAVVQGDWQENQQQHMNTPPATHFAAWCP